MENYFKFRHKTSLMKAISIMKSQSFLCGLCGNIQGDYVLNGYVENLTSQPSATGVIIEFAWYGEIVEIHHKMPEKASVLYIDYWRTAIRPPYHDDALLIRSILIEDEGQLSFIEIPLFDKFKIFLKSVFSKNTIETLEKEYRLDYIASLHNYDKGIHIHIPDWKNHYSRPK